MWSQALALVLSRWRVIATAGALLACFVAGWQVNGWRWAARYEAHEKQAAQQLASGWEAALKLYRAQQAQADAAQKRADDAIRRLRKERDRWQATYNAALRDDPACAEQAAQVLRCPV